MGPMNPHVCSNVPSSTESYVCETVKYSSCTGFIIDQYIGLFLYSSPIQNEANVLVWLHNTLLIPSHRN